MSLEYICAFSSHISKFKSIQQTSWYFMPECGPVQQCVQKCSGWFGAHGTRQFTGRLLSPRYSLKEKRAKSDRHKAERKYTKTCLLIHKQIHICFKQLVDWRICDNHRGISLLEIAGKILTKMCLNRLQTHLECATDDAPLDGPES